MNPAGSRVALQVFSFLLFFSLLATTCTMEESPDEPSVTAITGAILFDGNGSDALENSVILVEGDQITCVGTKEECPVPSNAEAVDASGKFITPGLIDGHVHFFQTGFFDSRPDAMDITETYPFPKVAAYQKQHPERYYNSYLCSGITGVYDVGGMSWSIDFQQSAEQNPNAPHVAAAGPLITPVSGAPFDLPSDKVLVPLESSEAGIKTVQYLSALGSTGIKLWQLDADSEAYMERVRAVAEETEKQNNKLIVHATTLEQATAAVEAGAKLLVHSVGDVAVDQNFLDLAKEQGTYYNPTLIVSSGYMMAYRAAAGIEPLTVDDPNSCVDSKTLDLINSASQFENHPRFSNAFLERIRNFDASTDRVSETQMQNLMRVYEAGIPIIVGTDAGNPGTLHGPSIYEEMEYMQQAGIPAKDLIVMATRNGAEAMERGDDFGTLEPGKLANLIILDEDPSADIANMRSVRQVMIKGELKAINEFTDQ